MNSNNQRNLKACLVFCWGAQYVSMLKCATAVTTPVRTWLQRYVLISVCTNLQRRRHEDADSNRLFGAAAAGWAVDWHQIRSAWQETPALISAECFSFCTLKSCMLSVLGSLCRPVKMRRCWGGFQFSFSAFTTHIIILLKAIYL